MPDKPRTMIEKGETKMFEPAPYDWHDAKSFRPPVDEIVNIYQMYPPWAIWTGEKWVALDQCGNRHYLSWTPEFWRREYRPIPPTRR